MGRDKDYVKMINSARWRELRGRALAAHPLCQDCEAQGLWVPATEVHHVVPVETAFGYAEKERLMFNPTNLRCLCHSCHMREHRDAGKNTREGRKQRRKDRLDMVRATFFED